MDVSASRIGAPAELAAQLAIELPVARLAAAIAFYQQAGFQLERRTETFAALQIDGRYLLLTHSPAAQASVTPPNLRIMVADVERAFAHAQAQGWPIRQDLQDRGYGLRDFTVTDPDGHEVRFAAPAQA